MPYSISGFRCLFLHSPKVSAWRVLPFPPRGPHSGFGYPRCGFCIRDPWKPFSAPNARGLFPTELCSFSVAVRLFPTLRFRSCAFEQNQNGHAPTLQRVNQPRSRTPYRYSNYSFESEPLLSWDSGLLGVLLLRSMFRASPSKHALLALRW